MTSYIETLIEIAKRDLEAAEDDVTAAEDHRREIENALEALERLTKPEPGLVPAWACHGAPGAATR